MLIATFGPSTAWVGKNITREGEVFILEGHGPITADDVLTYDRQGHLNWPYEGMRAWVHGLAAAGAAAPGWATPARPLQAARRRTRFPRWVLVVVALYFGVSLSAAIAIPMYLNQRALSNESAVRDGIDSIQVGVRSWAVDHANRYPDPSLVSEEGLATYVKPWPTNPYTGSPMRQGNGPGDFSYVVARDHTSFELTGQGEDGTVITVP